MPFTSNNKITIYGAGFVGSTIAYSLLAEDFVEEITLIDINAKLVAAQVMDLEHSTPFLGQTSVKAGTENDLASSDIAIIACGAAQKPGQTRLELVQKNSSILNGILPGIFKQNPHIIVLIVTNPVDILTHLAIERYPQYKNQIFGSGTLLDSARLRQLLGHQLDINPQSVHAYILGEHGDSEFPLWSAAMIGSTPLARFRLSEKVKRDLFERAKNAAYTIIEGKQATYYAIGAGVAKLVHTILGNEKSVLPVSHCMDGDFGIRGICLSIPRIIGRNGVVGSIPLEMNTQEKKQLRQSAIALKKVLESLS
ncbi:MAG: L-lactate dehydrogenase [Patescibacteria group bacterium]